MKNHKPEWDVYCEMRTRFTAKVNQAKEDKKEACEWKTVRCDSTMSGQARVVYHFYKRWASVFLFSCLFIMFIFRFFLTFVSPQCIGLIQTQEL